MARVMPYPAPTLFDALSVVKQPEIFSKVVQAGGYHATFRDRYYHWDTLRYLAPPAGITHKQWWAGIKLARVATTRALPLLDTEGDAFKIALPDVLLRQLSEIDRSLSGRAQVSDELTNPGTRDRYLMSALIQEAITSSQLEGATTTREVANDMLRSGRAPRDKSERMIVNNFRAMQFIRGKTKEPLTADLIRAIHREVTDATLEPHMAGQFRSSDDIRVKDVGTGDVLHTPPTHAELPTRMKAMCAFANAGDGDPWVHPILRAILLHFWLAYDHPFVDGNGRTARALFYWYMLKAEYALCEFISISQILHKAPAKYSRAFLYTETDENDTTYFALYQLGVLQRAVAQLHEYVAEKIRTIHETHKLVRQCGEFNYRQIALLGHALRTPDHPYSVASHATSHGVTRPTARKDLNELAQHGLLSAVQTGKALVYFAPNDVEQRLERFGRARMRR